MTIYALLLYAISSSTAVSDSDRMSAVIYERYRDQPTLELVSAGQAAAPVDPHEGDKPIRLAADSGIAHQTAQTARVRGGHNAGNLGKEP